MPNNNNAKAEVNNTELESGVKNPDQAGDLRQIISDRRGKVIKSNAVNMKIKTPVHTLSIVSGKGGVGKSNIAASLACCLADHGKRVVLLDADLGMANLDILCGVKTKYSVANLIDGSRDLNEILIPFEQTTNHGSVTLLPGGAGLKDLADLEDYAMDMLFDKLAYLDEVADYLIMDAGAGIHKEVLAFAHASDITLLITTPEPTSIRDAYGVLKSLGSYAWKRSDEKGVMLVVNMARDKREAFDVAERIRLASMQFLGNAPIYLGYIQKDSVIERSVRNCRIFYRQNPESPAADSIRSLAAELLKVCEGREITGVERSAGFVKSFFTRLAQAFFPRV